MTKRTCLLVVYCLICATLNCVAQVTSNTPQEENLAKKFITSSKYRELPQYYSNINFFLTTSFGNIEYGPRGVIVYLHEASHVYDNVKSAAMGNMLFFWNGDNPFLKTKIISKYSRTDSIISLLPSYVLDKLLTKTYISCTNDCFSQHFGIYGLLEEFNAFSVGSEALLDMYSYFDTCQYTAVRTKFWEGYLNCLYDSRMNFFYFNIYFSAYLRYVAHSNVFFYNQLLADADFKNTFDTIYKRYWRALKSLDPLEVEALKKVNTKGNQKYTYSFMDEFKKIHDLSDMDDVKNTLSILVDSQ